MREWYNELHVHSTQLEQLSYLQTSGLLCSHLDYLPYFTSLLYRTLDFSNTLRIFPSVLLLTKWCIYLPSCSSWKLLSSLALSVLMFPIHSKSCWLALQTTSHHSSSNHRLPPLFMDHDRLLTGLLVLLPTSVSSWGHSLLKMKSMHVPPVVQTAESPSLITSKVVNGLLEVAPITCLLLAPWLDFLPPTRLFTTL